MDTNDDPLFSIVPALNPLKFSYSFEKTWTKLLQISCVDNNNEFAK